MARWIPRPVTNVCTTTVHTIRGITTAIDPSGRARPNGSEPKNTITAEVVDQLEPVIKAEHKLTERFWEADWWALVLGCVWLHPYWDRDDLSHTEFVQAMECPECGFLAHPLDIEEGQLPGCPDCGYAANLFRPATRSNPDTGQEEPLGDDVPIGSGATDVVSPLEMLVPTYVQRWGDADRLIRLRWRPKSYYEGRPYEHQIQYRSTPADRSLQMYRSLATMTGQATPGAIWAGGQNTGSRLEGVIEAELWCKPTSKYPKGLWARFAGGAEGGALILRDEERGVRPGPIPYLSKQGKALWPWAYLSYEDKGGSIWSRSCLDGILQKQDQINRNDSMVELIMQRMANPIWLEPKGAEVQRFTGEPGLIVRYQVVAGTNAKPERLEGVSPPAAFFTLRTQYFDDVEKQAGTRDVLSGSTPSGVEAFSALNLLVERSQAGFTPYFKARGKAFRDWFEVAIELERVHGPQVRVKATLGENDEWTYETFQNAQLDGAVTIYVEDGSDVPKTSLGKRAALQQAQAFNAINMAEPDQLLKTLQLLGISDIAPGLDAHTKAAQIEQYQYLAWVGSGRQGPNPMVAYAWNNHAIHIQQLDRWANSDRVRALIAKDPQMVVELRLHRLQHMLGMQNIFGEPQPMAMPGAAPGQPGGAGAPGQPGGGVEAPGAPADTPPVEGAARAMQNSNQESGAIDTLPGAPGNNGAGNMAL
jgi:ssDNA-binding Zn-finger/Zn-ribbon topoisomerase 1